jgi:sugar phosphate isomerase/epimerase
MVPVTHSSPLAKHHPTGASTGFLGRRGDWDRLLEEVEEQSRFSAELAALSEPEFRGLRDWLAHAVALPFRYLSVHAPVKERQATEEQLVEWLADLPGQVDSVVTHPDTIEDAGLYREVGSRLVIENMDDRKESGRTVEELEMVFDALPEAGFCFDIAHAWSVDPSMEVAEELLDCFGSRLRQVHLSSLVDGKHASLLEEHEALFAPLLERCRDVPWILEAARPARWR